MNKTQGQLHVIFLIYQIMNDTRSENYVVFDVIVQNVPGTVLGNDWEADRIQVYFNTGSHGIIDYSPTTTSTGEVYTLSAGFIIGATLPLPWLGSLNWVTIRDVSNLGVNVTHWYIYFDTWGDPANAPSDSAFLMKFTFTIEVPQGQNISVLAYFRVWYQNPARTTVDYIASRSITISSSELVSNT